MLCRSEIAMPKAVFWDWDGTIVDSYNLLNDAHNHTLVELGFSPFKDGEYRNYFGKPRDILYPAIYKDKGEAAKIIFSKYILENSHNIEAIMGVSEILNMFHTDNITMGIVSNKKADLIAQEVKNLGFDDYFTVIIGAGDAKKDKPSGGPLLLALDRSGIDYNLKDTWYIGDTENDLACAKEAGCHAVFYKDNESTNKLVSKYLPIISFDNYQELKDILVAI